MLLALCDQVGLDVAPEHPVVLAQAPLRERGKNLGDEGVPEVEERWERAGCEVDVEQLDRVH